MFFLGKTDMLHNNKIAKTDKYVLWQIKKMRPNKILFGRKHQCLSLDKYLLAFICDIDMSLLKRLHTHTFQIIIFGCVRCCCAYLFNA